MRVGIAGHQRRVGLDWNWVENELTRYFLHIKKPIFGFSSLAAGSDQIFARAVLRFGGNLTAVIPFENYERTLSGDDLVNFNTLLKRASIIQLPPADSEKSAYYAAERFIIDQVDQLIAIWDGMPAKGFGGTADAVEYAIDKGVSVLHLNTILKETSMR